MIGTTQILRTPSPEYDVIAAITADRFDVPIALVNIDDGDDVWMKAKVGLDLCSAPKNVAFCGHVLETAQPLIVENLLADPRFSDHPLVVGEMAARFYAGTPLIDRHGAVFGTLCIIDRRPRTFGDRDKRALALLSEQVIERVELSEMRQRERSAAVIDQTTTDAFITCDRHGRITHWNTDLLPVSWTALSWKIPVMKEGQGSGASDEEVEVFGGADRLRAEAGRGRHECWRGVPQNRDQRSDVLGLAQEVCRADAVGDAAAAPA